MKTKITFLLLFSILFNCNIFSQCRNVNINEMTRVLKQMVEPSIAITLDRDNSQISLLGVRQRFSIPAENISKAGHDWRYHVQDLRSDDSNLWWGGNDRRHFMLDIRFEGDGSEIKGLCPGCIRMSRDRRAPDINWVGARIARLHFRPIPFEGSITIEITQVELFGEFDVNGFLESLFPRMVRNIERNIKTRIQNNVLVILNRNDIRRNIATNLRAPLRAMGITNVRRIRLSPDRRNVQFCQ